MLGLRLLVINMAELYAHSVHNVKLDELWRQYWFLWSTELQVLFTMHCA